MEIRKLNSLRALAALIVFITHFSDITNWLNGTLGGGSGAYGVMLFFMLSGFLMSFLYLAKDFNKSSIKHYFLARAARVLPLYFTVVFGSYFLTQADSSMLYNISDVNSLMSHLFFLKGESVLWSIPPEIHFYLLFIVFWSFAKTRKGYIHLFCFTIMILLFLTNFPRIYGEIAGVQYNIFSSLRTLPYFFVGVIFGLHYKNAKMPPYLKSHWFVLVLCLIPLLYPELSPITSDAKKRMWLSYEVLIVMASVFFCVVYLVPDNNVLLTNKLGDFIGKISYSLYLLHMPIIKQVNQLNILVEAKLLLALTLSVFIAYLSYRFFERPIANFIRAKNAN